MADKQLKGKASNLNKSQDAVCIHCGDPLGKRGLEEEGRHFCCPGCRAVYNLLHDSELSDYYDLQEKPGLKPDQHNNQDQFLYLDNEEIREKLLEFNDGKSARITFAIPQIHCSSCIWLLENLYKLNGSIHSSRVDFIRRKLSVVFDIDKLSLRQLVELLVSIGYEPEINLSSTTSKSKDRSARTIYARVAIAGFCFGNVMLLSFPEYLGMETTLKTGLGIFIDYLKIVLSLPVAFYCAADFYLPAFRGIRTRQINMDVPITLGISVLFLRSLYEILIVGQAGYLDSLCALVFLLLVGRLYQRKTYFSLKFDRDNRSYLPLSVIVKRDNTNSCIPLENLKEGERIIIRNRELIPADAILISDRGQIDYSFVTGESVAESVSSGDRVFAGGRQTGPAIELEVIKKPSRSYLFQLWEDSAKVISSRDGLSSLSNRVSRYFTPAVLLISALSAGYWLINDPSRALDAATAVLIIACPCALALTVPFTLGVTQRIMGRSRFFVKDGSQVEKMARLTKLVFDKTGTITQSGASRPEFVGAKLTGDQESLIYSVVKQSTHPLSALIADLLSGSSSHSVKSFHEMKGKGLEGAVNGYNIRIGSYRWVGGGDNANQDQTAVYVSIDDDIMGYYRIDSHFRKGLGEVISSLKEKFSITLLSGDNESDKPMITAIFGERSDLHFNQLPGDKLRQIALMIKSGERVAMIGDGLNDAGALRAAHVGIAVVEKDGAFSPASDCILYSSGFRFLPAFFQYASDSLRIVKIGMGISIVYNLVGLAFAVQGILSPLIAAILMPASSITIVLFSTIAATWAGKRRGLV